MENLLYLDTARVGRPLARTLQAAMDSLLLASVEGGSAYFDQLLRHGMAACPNWMTNRFPSIQDWRGVPALKSDLRKLVGVEAELPVLLANRSSQLMEFVARLFFPQCRNVLTCDLGWPAYHAVLADVAAKNGGRVTAVLLRDRILSRRATVEEIVNIMAQEYVANRCDGLFLPAVSNLGVRFPIERIVKAIRAEEVRFFAVDGAQEFCHMKSQGSSTYCDFYLTGCHKWLAAHHPMGVGFYGHRRSREFVEAMLQNLLRAGKLDDPLLRFTDQLESGTTNAYSETVNLSGLFTCQAAIAERLRTQHVSTPETDENDNRTRVAELIAKHSWEPVITDERFNTAIMMAHPNHPSLRQMPPAKLRMAFRNHGVSLTAYEDGAIRLSLPQTPLTQAEQSQLQAAFASVV